MKVIVSILIALIFTFLAFLDTNWYLDSRTFMVYGAEQLWVYSLDWFKNIVERLLTIPDIINLNNNEIV